MKSKPATAYQADLRILEKDVSNIKKSSKLLSLLNQNKDLIYSHSIQQFSLEDKFDEAFRAELSSLFQLEVKNATDFVKGIQKQLRLDLQYKDKIFQLVKDIQQKLGIPFETPDEMLKYLALLARKLVLPYDVTLFIQSQGTVIPMNLCRRFDEFRKEVS
jgi:hypothetical protein